MTCPETPNALGVYVLGALSAEERRRFEEHLDGCALCAAELAEFAGIPVLLDRVRPEDLQPVAVTPSPELFDRVSAAARIGPSAAPRRRRWRLVAAALLVLVATATGVTVWAFRGGSDTVTATSGAVRATLAVTGQEQGTVLELTVAGLRPGETCRMVAVDEDGDWHPAGDWAVSQDGDGRWRGWADVQRDDLREVHVYGDGDRELVVLPL